LHVLWSNSPMIFFKSYILFICEVLFIKAMKIWLLNLLVWIFLISSLLLQIVWMQVRLCVLLFCACTWRWSVISSLIVGIFKSVCKRLLNLYYGAFTIFRRTLFWYVCNIAMFELLAVPQRGILYVQLTNLNVIP
jgi:hypothetical protein